MRIWSLHPIYLDTKGLVALWREGLLAQKVLSRKTKGYVDHPQLARFKKQNDPLSSIGFYLLEVWKEAKKRGYRFDCGKILRGSGRARAIEVTSGQMKFELGHLRKKLKKRDAGCHKAILKLKAARPNRLFKVVDGKVEDWEK